MAKFIGMDSRVRGAGVLMGPTQETANALEDFIRWCEEEVPTQLMFGMSKLALFMALTNQKEARKLSFGPYDPSMEHPEDAWQLPVRRITQAYYLGWKVRMIGPGIAQLYNDSREAFFIEFGINWLGEGRRVRRPVRKLSLIKTLRQLETTHIYHRIWSQVFIHKGKGFGFTQHVQSPGGAYVTGWEDISRQTAINTLRASDAGTMAGAGIRFGGRKGFRRAIYNRGGGSYSGPRLGRRLP